MATSRRQKQRVDRMDGRSPAQASRPTTVAPTLPPQPAAGAPISPAAERSAFVRRRAVALAGLAAAIVLVAVLAMRFLTPPAGIGTPSLPAPALVSEAPSAVGLAGSACSAIAGLPVFAGATCIEQDRDTDDGETKLKNTYIASAAADEVRHFYEQAFSQNGWKIDDTDHDTEDREWQYTIVQGPRTLKVKIAAQQGTQTDLTEVRIAED